MMCDTTRLVEVIFLGWSSTTLFWLTGSASGAVIATPALAMLPLRDSNEFGIYVLVHQG